MRHNDDAHPGDIEAERIFQLTRPHKRLLTLYIIYSVMATVGFIFVFPPLFFRYITLRYRFDQDGVAVSYGILWRKETYLTYARIQDIHVTRNIFERWLGLGTVKIQTASGSTTAVEAIVGVTEFHEIRNYLYARMRGLKPKRKSSVAATGTLAASETATENSLEHILIGIRDDLRAIRAAIEGRADV